VSEWPPIVEPELLRRLGMDDEQFAELLGPIVAALQPRACDEAAVARALAYPWERPEGSYLLSGGAIAPLAELDRTRRDAVLARFAVPGGDRVPVLAIGSNAAPETLQRKFAHLESAADRDVLALSGRLHDFDVGVAAQPTLYGSMPATLFASPGTAVRATLLWVTPLQFTQLAWSEITYRLGRLRTRFEVDDGAAGFDEVLVFASRFGAFCPDREPAALAAIAAAGRTAPALSQQQLLDAAARLAMGGDADAESLIRALFERPAELLPRLRATVNRAAEPLRSDRWTPFSPAARGEAA
jgi:hypothetical protein